MTDNIEVTNIGVFENLVIPQGTDYFKNYIIYNNNTTLQDLSLYSAQAMFRVGYDGPVLLTLTTVDGSIAINTLTSTVTLNFWNALTSALVFKGKELELKYDVELIGPTLTTRIAQGTALITREITR